MADWLDGPEDDSWLDTDDVADPSVQAPRVALPYDALRFACMRGSGRVWACDGRYVAYRPFNHVLDKAANPAFQERIERFTRAGHFKHLGTFDEVLVFQLEPESPWYAKTDEQYVAGKSLWKDIAHAIKLAMNRDWKDYVDLLEAMAVGMKAGRPEGFAQKAWEDAVNQIMIGISQRNQMGQLGPLPAEIRAACASIMAARRGPKVLLATDAALSRNIQYER